MKLSEFISQLQQLEDYEVLVKSNNGDRTYYSEPEAIKVLADLEIDGCSVNLKMPIIVIQGH